MSKNVLNSTKGSVNPLKYNTLACTLSITLTWVECFDFFFGKPNLNSDIFFLRKETQTTFTSDVKQKM